jgi:isopentenyl diphosphate isomerase/L-lactate dehydrogenase-like FMN-dependent dehydrogenase
MSGFASRRRFLSWLASSPLLAAQHTAEVITDPKQALNVLDFEAAARRALPPAHFGYMATGVEDDATLRANREAFARLYLRPRRLVDITQVDTRVELFGTTWETPIALAPVGNMKAFHAEGEMPVAAAAREKRTLQILSTMTNTPLADVNGALGRPAWYQLYTTNRWAVTEQLVQRAESAGCGVIVATVDTQAGSRRETFERFRLLDKRPCESCHGTKREDFFRRKAMFHGLDVTGLAPTNPAMTWKDLDRLRKLVSGKLLIKGIETREDTEACLNAGVDGIIVSNHGGRAEESGRGTLDCLPEVVEAASGRVVVLVDGGIRRGADVFKALALGARAVCIGRPYVWGLAAFGQPGVERVLDILRGELELTMKQCGTRRLTEIARGSIGYHARVPEA